MAKPWLMGIEIGGTKLQLGLGRGDGTIAALRRSTVRPADGAAGIRAQIQKETEALLWTVAEGGKPAEAAAVGIGFGGPVHAEAGVIATSNQIDGWTDFPLADWVRETLGVPVVALQNDADTAALGESRFGAGVGRSPVLYVTIGSGVGGGLIVDGRIYRGGAPKVGAIEIGHLRVGPDGETLEALASGWSIGRRAADLVRSKRGSGTLGELVDGDPEQITAEVVAMAASLGDTEAAEILGSASRALADALGHAVALLAPQRIILGGGVSLIGEDLWFRPVRERLDRRAFGPLRGTFDVVPAKLGESVVIHGALALARDLSASGSA